MGLATIDPHSQKEHTHIHKIPKFGVNRASFDAIQEFKNVKNLYKEMYGNADKSDLYLVLYGMKSGNY